MKSVLTHQKRFASVVLIGVALVAVSACGYALHNAARPYESGEFADVTWEASGEPMTVAVTVRDLVGHPVPGVAVYVDNNSGGNGGTTNADGVATLEMGESDFSGLEINGVWVVRRPRAYRLGSPNVVNGLRVEVRLKEAIPNAAALLK